MNVLVTSARAPISADIARVLVSSGNKVWMADSLRVPVGASTPGIEGYVRLPPPRQDFGGFVAALHSACLSRQIERIIPTSEEVMWLARAAKHLPVGVVVYASPFDLLARLHNKATFAVLATELGYGLTWNRVLVSRADCDDLGDASGLVLKPVFSRFGTRVLVAPKPREMAAVHPTAADPWLAQSRAEGREICSYNIADRGRLLLHVGYEPRFQGRLGASVYFAPVLNAELRQMTERFVAATGFTGQISFDAIETSHGLVALECNPRGTSGVHLAAQNPAALAAALMGEGGDVEVDMAPEPRMLLFPLLLNYPETCFTPHGRASIRVARDALRIAGVPLWGQLRAMVEMAARSARLGVGIAAACTSDFEWNGET